MKLLNVSDHPVGPRNVALRQRRGGAANLLSTSFWALLFYVTYAASFALSLALPLGLVQIGRWIDLLVERVGLQVPILVHLLTVGAALYVELVIVYVFIGTLAVTFLYPTGIVIEAVSESAVDLPTFRGQIPSSSLSDLAGDVTKQLHVAAFKKTTVTAKPTAETKTRRLILGWPLICQLTENELKAIIAHEAAHYDKRATVAHRWIWALNEKVKYHQYLTETSLERLWLRERRKGGLRLGLALPMAGSALGLARLLLVVPQTYFLRRLGRGNYPFEFYCDSVSAGLYGGNVMSAALEKVERISVSFSAFVRELALSSEPSNIFREFEEFQRYKLVPEETHAELYWRHHDSHPSLRSRLEKLVAFPNMPNQMVPWLDAKSRAGFEGLEQSLTSEFTHRLLQARKVFEQGLVLAKAGDFLDAGPLLRRAASLLPESGNVVGWLGVYHSRMRRPSEAHHYLLKAWRLMGAEEWKQQPEFHSSFVDATQKHGGSLMTWFHEGVHLLRKSRYESAVDAFDTILICDPCFQDPFPLFEKARCLEGLGRLGEAQECYEAILEKHPNNVQVAIKLASALTQRVAIRMWAGLVIPSQPSELVRRECETTLSKDDRARLERALELTDGGLLGGQTELCFTIIATRAVVLRMLHRYTEAAECYKEILRGYPEDSLTQEFLKACGHFSDFGHSTRKLEVSAP